MGDQRPGATNQWDATSPNATDSDGRHDRDLFPLAAVVGADEAITALCLMTLSPQLGAAAIIGEHGSGKSTIARGFAELLPFGAPFVEARFDSLFVVGTETDSRDISPDHEFQAADGGFLYFDRWRDLALCQTTINEHLDRVRKAPTHRDPSEMGDPARETTVGGQFVGRVRPGAQRPLARFVVLASVEDPTLLTRSPMADRFAMLIQLESLTEAERAEMLRRQLHFAHDPAGFCTEWAPEQRSLARRLELARPAEIGSQLLRPIAAVCDQLGIRTARADIALAQAAAAHAGWHGRRDTAEVDLFAVAPLVLGHRVNRTHNAAEARKAINIAVTTTLGGALGPAPERAAALLNSASGSAVSGTHGAGPQVSDTVSLNADYQSQSASHPPTDAGTAQRVDAADASDGSDAGATKYSPSAHEVHEQPNGQGSATHQDEASASGDAFIDMTGPAVEPELVIPIDRPNSLVPNREPAGHEATAELLGHRSGTGSLIVLVVDSSSNPGAEHRIDVARRAALDLLGRGNTDNHHVAVVSFCDSSSQLVLRPTNSAAIAGPQLESIPSGGATPLIEGITTGLAVACRPGTHDPKSLPLLVYLTNGSSSYPADRLGSAAAAHSGALDAAERVGRRQVLSLVVDWSPDALPRDTAKELAERMGAVYLTPAELNPESFVATLRNLLHQSTTQVSAAASPTAG